MIFDGEYIEQSTIIYINTHDISMSIVLKNSLLLDYLILGLLVTC